MLEGLCILLMSFLFLLTDL